MGVVLTDHVTDDTGGFLISPIPIIVKLMHREQNATMNRLQTVPHVGQGSAHNDAHGIVQIGPTHLVF